MAYAECWMFLTLLKPQNNVVSRHYYPLHLIHTKRNVEHLYDLPTAVHLHALPRTLPALLSN